MNKVDHSEPFALNRLLIRSAILGLLVSYRLMFVTQGDFLWAKFNEIVLALMICLVLYGLEKAVLWPFRNRLSIKPIQSAAYRGALLCALMNGGLLGDWAMALGPGIVGALIAAALYKAEEGAIQKFVKRSDETPRRLSHALSEGWKGFFMGGGVTLAGGFGLALIMGYSFPKEMDGGPGILISALAGVGSFVGGFFFFVLRFYRSWTSKAHTDPLPLPAPPLSPPPETINHTPSTML